MPVPPSTTSLAGCGDPRCLWNAKMGAVLIGKFAVSLPPCPCQHGKPCQRAKSMPTCYMDREACLRFMYSCTILPCNEVVRQLD